MPTLTIVQAIKQIMFQGGVPLTIQEVYSGIVGANLYMFRSDTPLNIVRSQIRRHCIDLDFTTSSPTKHFKLVGTNKYYPLERPVRASKRLDNNTKRKIDEPSPTGTEKSGHLDHLFSTHEQYIQQFKKRILGNLSTLTPQEFELFSKKLIDAYGFHDTKVTQISNDGGIDGYGKLLVGLASINVAFQCKKWTKGKIQRPEIDKFRGAAQGDFEQGILFTTASFSKGAIDISVKRGAIPIILIDGEAIVELMIKKRFGVQVDTLEVPSYALDLALSPE